MGRPTLELSISEGVRDRQGCQLVRFRAGRGSVGARPICRSRDPETYVSIPCRQGPRHALSISHGTAGDSKHEENTKGHLFDLVSIFCPISPFSCFRDEYRAQNRSDTDEAVSLWPRSFLPSEIERVIRTSIHVSSSPDHL